MIKELQSLCEKASVGEQNRMPPDISDPKAKPEPFEVLGRTYVAVQKPNGRDVEIIDPISKGFSSKGSNYRPLLKAARKLGIEVYNWPGGKKGMSLVNFEKLKSALRR